MSHNLEYLLTRPGGLKIGTVILGIVASVLSSHSFGESPYSDFYAQELSDGVNDERLPGTELELYNMTSAFLFLGISFLYLAAHALFYAVCESRLNKFIDTAFHMSGALFLFAGGTTVLYSAVMIEQHGCPEFEKWLHNSTTGGVLRNWSRDFIEYVSLGTLHTTRFFQPNPSSDFCHYFGEKVIAGSFNLLNAVLYGFLGFVIFTTEVEEL